jgi:hypothetical protein
MHCEPRPDVAFWPIATNFSLSTRRPLLGRSLYRCDELYDKIPIGNGPGHGRHYHVANNTADFLIMQDSTNYWTLHSTVNTDEEMKLPGPPNTCRMSKTATA